MKIHNIRLGFATNSSSLHSAIILKGRKPIDDSDHHNFGWDFFTLASTEMKNAYLEQQRLSNYYTQFRIKHKNRDTEFNYSDTLNDIIAEKGLPEYVLDGYIDHQSVWDLPVTFDESEIDPEFWTALQKHYLQQDVVILGGNDNILDPDDHHPLQHEGLSANVPLSRDRDHTYVARYDTVGQYWVLFNRDNGTKIRFTFEDVEGAIKPTKASAPELVDLKITDFCTKGCPYCYQGSTPNGLHASFESITEIADELARLKVFEVALGGGEPTQHPRFHDIVTMFRQKGIIPNFSTRNLEVLKDRELFRHIGGFAYSIDNADQIDTLKAAIDAAPLSIKGPYEIIPRENEIIVDVSVQVALGTITAKELKKIFKKADEYGMKVTLLGFKEVGRGEYFDKHKTINWLKIAKELNDDYKCPTIGIDTMVAKKWELDLKSNNISTVLYSTEEGKFSMYIDAVRGRMAASSYDPKMYLLDLPNLLKLFSTF